MTSKWKRNQINYGPKVLGSKLLGIGLLFLYPRPIVEIQFSSWTCLAIILVVDIRICHILWIVFIPWTIYWALFVPYSDIGWHCSPHQHNCCGILSGSCIFALHFLYIVYSGKFQLIIYPFCLLAVQRNLQHPNLITSG